MKEKINFVPDRYLPGECFICKEKCPERAYCHHECALAYGSDLNKKNKE